MARKPTEDQLARQATDDKEPQSLDSVLAKINTANCRPVSQRNVKQCLKVGANCYWFKQTITTYECCDAASCYTITVATPFVRGGKCECGGQAVRSAMPKTGCGCC